MTRTRPFRLATRSSPLALWQADTTAKCLEAAFADLLPQRVEVASSGDRDQQSALSRFGRIGIFTVEVDRAVIEGRAECAVHSLKDLTTELQEGTMLSGVLGRGPVEDAIVTRDGRGLEDLEAGARVATGSLRRRAMVCAARADLELVEMRGNVQTRLDKLDRGEVDALILARAGLERLGLGDRIGEVLDTERFLPAVGQGIVGLVCRGGDWASHERVQAIRDLEAWDEALAERACLRALRGGCNVPVGAHARAIEGTIVLKARVLALDGSRTVEGEIGGPRGDAESLGRALGEQLAASGAGDLIDEARRASS